MKVLLAAFLVLVVCTSALPQRTRIVAAAEANGTYRYRRNEIKMTSPSFIHRILRTARLPSNFFGGIRSTSLRIVLSIAVLA